MSEKKHTHHSTRTRIKTEIRNLNLDSVETREKRQKPETNAFIEAKVSKKREKVEREHQKNSIYHLANKKKLKSRWILEEEFTDDFPEEKEL
jgi:hypothetical protein